MKNSRKLIYVLILSSIVLGIILYPFYKCDIIATLFIAGLELACLFLYPIYITKLTFIQLEFSARCATINRLIAHVLRVLFSFVPSPFCTSIGLAVSAVYQLVSTHYIIKKNKLDLNVSLQ